MTEKAERPYKFLRVSVTVFKVLAWLTMVVQAVTGLILVITGGEPIFIGGLELPTRVVGILNFVAAGVYFFSFWLMASLMRVVLDIRERLPGG